MIELSEYQNGLVRRRPVGEVHFDREVDVLVCGLGTAGALAALFSAQNSLSVLGIEELTCVGGTHTAGGVQGHYFGNAGGRYKAIDRAVREWAEEHHTLIGESRKVVLEQALCRAGAEICYQSSVCGVYLDKTRVIGARVLKDKEVFSVKARVVMDCTAEAYVAAMAGCEMQCGRESDGQMQPYSMVSMVYNGEKYRYNNIDFGRVDQYDPVSLSEAILFSRSYEIPEQSRKEKLIRPMPLIGIREGRRIVAEEGVSLSALFRGETTKSPMYYAYADLDKHGWDIAFDGEILGDWAIGANLGAYNVTVPVPYRAILPKGYEGLLVPCRALGVDRDISSCVRMIPDMKKLAEGAAEWATIAVQNKLSLREVPYEALRARLTESGCLKDGDDRPVRVDGKRNWDGTALVPRDVFWITNAEALEAPLRSEAPGEAIWSAKRMGETAQPKLRALLASENENLRKNAALALAATGDRAALPLLRDMLAERDGTMLKDCRKNNNLRGCMAIYWLGRLADRDATDGLMELIGDPKESEREIYQNQNLKTTRYKVADFNDVLFQFTSQAVMALIRIGKVHPKDRARIAESFERTFSSPDYGRHITARPQNSSEGNMVLALKRIALSAKKRWEQDQ